MGLAPYYRGTDCNFWALFDGNPELVGATIYLLSKGLDTGEILYHAISEVKDNPFIYTMSCVRSAFDSIVDRIKKLQNANIISSYKAVVNYKNIGLDVSALITITSGSSSKYCDFREKVNNTDEIIKCYSTTGNGSHVLFIVTKNTNSLEKLLSNIQQWPGVSRTETQLILSSYKE